MLMVEAKNLTTERSNQKPYIPSREEWHRTYGGTIYNSDFETEYVGKHEKTSPYARRIVADMGFDRNCAKNIWKQEHNIPVDPYAWRQSWNSDNSKTYTEEMEMM